MVLALMKLPVGRGKADFKWIVLFVISDQKGWILYSHLRNFIMIALSIWNSPSLFLQDNGMASPSFHSDLYRMSPPQRSLLWPPFPKDQCPSFSTLTLFMFYFLITLIYLIVCYIIVCNVFCLFVCLLPCPLNESSLRIEALFTFVLFPVPGTVLTWVGVDIDQIYSK